MDCWITAVRRWGTVSDLLLHLVLPEGRRLKFSEHESNIADWSLLLRHESHAKDCVGSHSAQQCILPGQDIPAPLSCRGIWRGILLADRQWSWHAEGCLCITQSSTPYRLIRTRCRP